MNRSSRTNVVVSNDEAMLAEDGRVVPLQEFHGSIALHTRVRSNRVGSRCAIEPQAGR
jgi:hypothetical protein